MDEIRMPETAGSLDPDRKAQGGRIEAPRHLAFIRKLPCLVSGTNAPSDAAHLRMAAPEHGKGATGMGTKPDDCWTVPLGRTTHRRQHTTSERAFWDTAGIDPFAVALALWEVSGDIEAGRRIIGEHVKPWRRT